jgi:hypothetical protein
LKLFSVDRRIFLVGDIWPNRSKQARLPIMGAIALSTTHDTCSALLRDHDTFLLAPSNASKVMQARILRLLPRTLSLLALNIMGPRRSQTPPAARADRYRLSAPQRSARFVHEIRIETRRWRGL